MSVRPTFDDILDHCRSSIILDEYFGLGIDDLLTHRVSRKVRRMLMNPYCRPRSTISARNDEGSTVRVDRDQFQVNLDVQQFSPNEITVKVTGDDTITVEGKHEERKDGHGYIARHFIRRYDLPRGHDSNKIVSKLSSDGILTITVPKEKKNDVQCREIRIIQTGTSSKAITNQQNSDMQWKLKLLIENLNRTK